MHTHFIIKELGKVYAAAAVRRRREKKGEISPNRRRRRRQGGVHGAAGFYPPTVARSFAHLRKTSVFFARECGEKLTREDKNIAKSQQMNFSSDDTPAEKPVREKKRRAVKLGQFFESNSPVLRAGPGGGGNEEFEILNLCCRNFAPKLAQLKQFFIIKNIQPIDDRRGFWIPSPGVGKKFPVLLDRGREGDPFYTRGRRPTDRSNCGFGGGCCTTRLHFFRPQTLSSGICQT